MFVCCVLCSISGKTTLQMSGKDCAQGRMRKGILMDLKQCEVLTIWYDIAVWGNLAGFGLLCILSTSIFIGLAVWFRGEVFAELRKKRRYSLVLGGIWLFGSFGLTLMILDRKERFVGHNHLATLIFTLTCYAGISLCYVCGMNTRDTAAAMDD